MNTMFWPATTLFNLIDSNPYVIAMCTKPTATAFISIIALLHMSSRIGIRKWIIGDIAKPVQILWIGITRYDTIRTQEPPQLGIIHSRAIIVNPQPRIALTGE